MSDRDWCRPRLVKPPQFDPPPREDAGRPVLRLIDPPPTPPREKSARQVAEEEELRALIRSLGVRDDGNGRRRRRGGEARANDGDFPTAA